MKRTQKRKQDTSTREDEWTRRIRECNEMQRQPQSQANETPAAAEATAGES